MLTDAMQTEAIPATFIRHAADILGDTQYGLSGSKIIETTSSYAVEFNVELPHVQSGIGVPNKRTSLYENLLQFTGSQQYRIIKELCGHPSLGEGLAKERKELKRKLVTRFRHLDPSPADSELNQTLIEETKHWLQDYPEALSLYKEALEKHSHGAFARNLLDDVRLSLEKLLHSLFQNQKSLENQKATVGSFIKATGGSAQLSNMFASLLSYYCQYQNDYIKHDDAVKEDEIEFILEITSSFMKHLIRIGRTASPEGCFTNGLKPASML